MTTKYQRQWTEFEALKSIYEKEFEEIKFPWKVDHPPLFKINFNLIVIELRMTKLYPDGLPELKLKSIDECVNEDELKDLNLKLKNKAELLKGNEMCFDLIEIVREYCVKKTQNQKPKTSFHSEMLLRQEEMEKKALDEQVLQLKLNEEKLLKQKTLEMEELENKIKEELEAKVKKESSFENKNAKVYSFDPPLMIELIENVKEEIRTVVPKYLELKSRIGIRNTLRVSNSKNNTISSENVNVVPLEFDLKIINLTHPFLQTFGGRRQLEILLKNLNNHQIKSHGNVLRCFGGSIDRQNHQMILLYEPFNADISISSLEGILNQAGSLAMVRIIEYLKGICEGLKHLHTSGLTHRSLDLDCVLIDEKRNVRICDYLIERCLNDLSREHGISYENWLRNPTNQWISPETISRPNFHGKKTDIWCVGRLTVQMIFGKEALKCWPGGLKDLMNSSEGKGLPDGIKDFLIFCLNNDAGMRMTAEELVNCKLFHEPIERMSNLMLTTTTTKDVQDPKALNSVSSNAKSNNKNKSIPTASRYLADFEELEFLGRGGFGSVVKVRNKIDDRFYAVKKIALDPRDVEYNKKMLREVTTLSRLHHERIVRYYQAWIEAEEIIDENEEGEEGEGSDNNVTHNQTFIKSESSVIPSSFTITPSQFKIFNDVSITESFGDNNDSEISSDFIQFEGDKKEDVVIKELNRTSISDSDSDDSDDDVFENNKNAFTETATDSSFIKPRGQVLYIQMEYCPNQTLRDLIDERASDSVNNSLDGKEIWRLFRQIIEGLVHIHAQGMMHRDLKPSNIFLDSNGDVKIGDFGLAVTRIESSFINRSNSPLLVNLNKSVTPESHKSESHTQNIGTPFYVSPEQIHSTSESARYNQKVDMYSLGIILIELWIPFGTGMERIQRLRDCRLAEMILPVNLEGNVVKIAKRLLCHEPKNRFTSLELLRSDLLPPILEEELMEDAMRSVVQPEAAHYSRLISTIFRKQNELEIGVVRPKDFAFDVHSGNGTDINYFDELSRLKIEIERVFLRHGALEVYPPLLYLPLSTNTNEEVYYVIDDAGQRLELPNNLTRPFARWIAQSSFKNLNLKRFEFDRVFKKVSQVAGGQPFQPREASFDLVHSEDELGLLETCEVVRVAFDALFAVGLKPEQLVFKCNNLRIREKIYDRINVKNSLKFKEEVAPVTFPGPGILYKTTNNNNNNSSISSSGFFDEKLVKTLTPMKSDEAPEMVLNRLGVLFGDDLKPTLMVMTNLLKMLTKISISPKVKVIFDPLLSGPRADLYPDEFCFVILKESEGKYHRRRSGGNGNYEMVGCGGRYNQLLEEYKFPTARLEGKGPFAVGVTLFLDRLSNRIVTNSISTNYNNNNNNYYNNTYTYNHQNNRKVLLNLSSDDANLEELKLIGELWNLGKIVVVVSNKKKTNLNNTNNNKFGDQIGSNGFSLQLQIKSSGGIVKIKSKNLKEIEEVSIDEIGNRLKSIFEDLSEFNSENNNNIDEFDEYYESSQDYLIGSNNNNNNSSNNNNNTGESFNVHYLLSHKSEKNPILREKALKAVRSLNPSKGEIIIHELPRDLLRKLLEKLNGNGILNPQSLSSSNNNNNNNNNNIQTKYNNEEEFREQIGRLGQVLGKLGNKMVVFFNHKDNQIDLIFNK